MYPVLSFFHRLPLSRKILLGIVPLFLLFITTSVVLQNYFQDQEMMEQAQVSAETYANIIKESLVSMMVNNLKVDEGFLERVNVVQQFDSVHILVNDLRLRNELLTPDRLRTIVTKHKSLQPHDAIEKAVLASGQTMFVRDGENFRAVVPFAATVVCQKCHAVPIGYTLGATDLHVSLSRVTEAAAGNWNRSLLIFVAFAILAIAVASLMFSRVVAKPVERLMRATTEISRGNLDYALVETDATASGNTSADHAESRDELKFLLHKFDEMRGSLKEKIGQLDHVNKRLSERNRELEDALARLNRAQEQLVQSERLAVTGTMTAQLSHEINNPIHNIQSLLESSLRKIDGSSQVRELIAVALEEVTRMAKLTRQMLDFYRTSVVEFEKQPVDVRELIMEVVRANEAQLGMHNVTIAAELPTELPILNGSRDKLKQVLLNLLINAHDAMPQGGRITITVESDKKNVCIAIYDTGVGIPPEHLNKVFDAFFTTKKEVSGVGLGLSVSHGIVHQHGGTIAVTSKIGEGTTFTIQLPVAGETNG